MRFTKMHGIGNDYVYVDCINQTVKNPNQLARDVSDRHRGIGSDGLILILPSDHADLRMRMFNVDGAEGEMCGNGICCVAKYAYENGFVNSRPSEQPEYIEFLKTAASDPEDRLSSLIEEFLIVGEFR